MEDRSAIALSSLEFGSRPVIDDLWLHGSSESLARLRRRAEATADAGCRVIVIGGARGVGKHRLTHWMHRRMAGAAAPRIDLDGRDLQSDIGASAGLMVVDHADGLDVRGAQALARRIAQVPHATLILIARTPLATLRETSADHEQLFGRMTEAILEVPPLAERTQDIAAIARAALDDACNTYDLPTLALSPGALTELEQQAWPGNARQIRGLLEQAALRAEGRWITPTELGFATPDAQAAGTLYVRLPGASLREIEIKAIALALELADNRIVRAAELLGITRHALRRKIDKFGVVQNDAMNLDPDGSI